VPDSDSIGTVVNRQHDSRCTVREREAIQKRACGKREVRFWSWSANQKLTHYRTLPFGDNKKFTGL
jgi:hypothetical protein